MEVLGEDMGVLVRRVGHVWRDQNSWRGAPCWTLRMDRPELVEEDGEDDVEHDPADAHVEGHEEQAHLPYCAHAQGWPRLISPAAGAPAPASLRIARAIRVFVY